MYNILICDDEKDIVTALKIYLKSDEYNLFTAYDGEEAVRTVQNNEIHLVLLDIMMPYMDGLETLHKIRELSNVPVIFLTAKSEDSDIVLGLTLGADDYVTKPFNPVEVQARVRSHLRRYMRLGSGIKPASDVFILGGIEINNLSKQVFLDGDEISLTPKEYDILLYLMKNPGVVFTPAEIYRKVWQEDPFGTENIVAVHVRHLREKIEYDPAAPRYLKSVWGRGYKMEAEK